MADIMDNGGPAFPMQIGSLQLRGMTLRDYFAGQALAGMTACSVLTEEAHEYAKCAYILADAMLVARNKQKVAAE